MKLHIDTKAYKSKPSSEEIAGIKLRLQKNAIPIDVSVEDLADRLRNGYAISPAVMGGISAADWKEQQLFLVDIDNEADEQLAKKQKCAVSDLAQTDRTPILTVEDALELCEEKHLPIAFYYHTFSSTPQKPKLRLAFIMDSPVTDPDMRKIIITTLVSLFPQSDKACTNADRIFHATDKEVVITNANARISAESIFDAVTQTSPAKPACGDFRQQKSYADAELERLKREFDFFGYLKERNGEYRNIDRGVLFKNCEVCGHHDNLMYRSDTNTFYCFSAGVGGSIIDYLMHTENLTLEQAIDRFKYELCTPDWKMPTPFDEIKLPTFPVSALPASLAEWVTAVALNTETAVDMAAACVLAILAACVQGKFLIAQNRNHSEPLNLYILIIAKSGERKSGIVRVMTEPIYQYEAAENSRRQPQIEKDEAQLRTWKNMIERYEKSGKAKEAAEMRLKYKELEHNRIKPLRLLADDVTAEALTSLLANNGGILTIISTEGGLFDTLSGKYTTSNEVSIDTVLKAYSGDRIRVDRKGRESECVDDPALTMLLSAQNDVLNGIMGNQSFKSRGLTARILYCNPESKLGRRKFETPDIPQELENTYAELVLGLLEIPYPTEGKPRLLRLNSEALLTLKAFFEWLEPQLVGGLEHTEGWAAKFIGTTLRIAGLLHCVEHKASPAKHPVSKQTMDNAIEIGRYFLEHAKYAFSIMGADKTLRDARHVLKKLSSQQSKELTKYQIFRLCRGAFTKADDVTPSLELLVEYGYLKERAYTTPTGGRPKAAGYMLNPLYFKH